MVLPCGLTLWWGNGVMVLPCGLTLWWGQNLLKSKPRNYIVRGQKEEVGLCGPRYQPHPWNWISFRLGNDETTGQSTSGLFVCVVCQVDLAPSEGISVHAGSIFSTRAKPWQGPFLCADCRDKKDAMEGKRPRGVKVS